MLMKDATAKTVVCFQDQGRAHARVCSMQLTLAADHVSTRTMRNVALQRRADFRHLLELLEGLLQTFMAALKQGPRAD